MLGVGAAVALIWRLNDDDVRRALEREATTWFGQPVRIGSASVTVFPRVALRLRDVRAGDPARITLEAVDVSPALRPLFAGRIEDAELVVSDTRLQVPLPLGLPASRSNGLAAEGTPRDANTLEVVSVRALVLRNVTIASLGRELKITAELSLQDGHSAITALTATSSGTRLRASGTIAAAPRIETTLEATAETLDMDDLLALVSAFTVTAGVPATPGQLPRLSTTVSAPRARAGDLDLTRFNATIFAIGNDITIDPLTFDLFGGRHNGWLDARLEETLQIRVGASLSNIDVAQLAGFEGLAGAIVGRLTGSGRFGASGKDLQSVLASSRGVGEVVVGAGAMPGLDIVGTIGRFLGGTTVGEPPASGEKFDEIAATFAVGDGVARSEDFTLRAPDYDLLGRGTLRLATSAVNGRADLVLSERVSAQAGTKLSQYVRVGDRIVLPATITGTLGQPRVEIDAADTLRRSLLREIERKLERLQERIRPF